MSIFVKNELNIASSKHSIYFSFLVDSFALKHTLTVEKDSSQSCGMAHLAFVPSHLRRENYTSSDSESWWAFIFNSIQFNLFSQVNVIQAFTLPALGKDYLRLKVWPHITKIYNWTFKVRNKERWDSWSILKHDCLMNLVNEEGLVVGKRNSFSLVRGWKRRAHELT